MEHEEQQQLMNTPLPASVMASRAGPGGTKLDYIEGFKAIYIANVVFGNMGWSSEILSLSPMTGANGSIIGYTSTVKVTSHQTGNYHIDVGHGVVTSEKFEAHEKGQKEAVTDATKRALRLFGEILGNSLYDRDGNKARKAGHDEEANAVAFLENAKLAIKRKRAASQPFGLNVPVKPIERKPLLVSPGVPPLNVAQLLERNKTR